MRPGTSSEYCPALQLRVDWQPVTATQSLASAPAMPVLLVMRYCSVQVAAV